MIPALQYLRHGKALCGKVFKRFVETFNFHNDFIANLKGDGDLPVSDGCLNLDRTDPTHPVIRLNKQKLVLPEQGNGTSGFPGRFEIQIEKPDEEDEQQTYKASFANPYYDVGGLTFAASVEDIELSGGEIIALKVNAKGREPSAEVVTYGSMDELHGEQTDYDYFIRPLYKIDGDFNVECDFRTGPTFDMGEFDGGAA